MSTINRFKNLDDRLSTSTTTNRFKGLEEQVPSQNGAVSNTRELNQFGLPVSYISQGSGTTETPVKDDGFLTKAAKFVLPRKAEDFFGLNDTEQQKQTRDNITSSYENKFAREDLGRLQQRIDPETGKLPTQTAGGVIKETPGIKYVPFFGAVPSIKDSYALYQAAKRLESGTNTPVDDNILAQFKAKSEQDKTFGAKVLNVLVELPAFAGELAATGGIFSSVKGGTQKLVTKGLETAAEKSAKRKAIESVLTRSVGNVAGATAQTIPARFLEITAETIQNMTPEYQYQPGEANTFSSFISEPGDDVWLAATKALSNQWVEVVSEKSGGIFNEALAPVKSRLMKLAVFKALVKKNPSLTSSKFMSLVNSAGWNGVLAEMGEERIGELMRGALTQVGLSEDGFKMPSKEQLAVELVSFAIPGAAIGIANKAMQSQDGSFKGFKTDTTGMTNYDNLLNTTDKASNGQTLQDYYRDEKGMSGEIITMSPDEYINRAAEGFNKDINELIETRGTKYPTQYAEKMNNGENFNMPVLDYSKDGFTQEGLNRAIAAKQLGINEMPVLVVNNKQKTSTITNQETAPTPKGPGHRKLNDTLDRMVRSGTLFEEDAVILKTLFEDTNDDYLVKLNLEDVKNLPALGRFRIKQRMRDMAILDGSNRLQMRKGEAENNSMTSAAKTFVHEYGHSGWYMILSQEERDMVKDVYRKLGRKGRISLFEKGAGSNPNYHGRAERKDVGREFWAESFAEYVMENKVPAEQMRPLLEKVGRYLYNGLKRLVFRGNVNAINKLKPLYEKILAGDKTTPLSVFANKEPPSFNAEVRKMIGEIEAEDEKGFQERRKEMLGKPTTKQVPVKSLFPGVTEQPIQKPQGESPVDMFPDVPPDLIDTVEPIEKVLEGDKRTPINERVRFIDYLRTPWRVFERMGIRAQYQSLLKAYENYVQELPKNIDKITTWSKQVSQEGNEKIFRSLDGETVELNPEEIKVKNEIKSWLRQWADRLGMDPDARISEYITHIFPFGKNGEIPEELAYVINKKIPGSVYDPFLLQRKGAEGYLKDTWAALDAYVKRATRKVHMDPALAELKDASDDLTDVSQLNYINKYVGTINMRPTELDTAIDNHIKELFGFRFGVRPTAAITRTIRKTIARAKIAGSVVSFGKNLTQGVNTFSELGTHYTTKGYIDLVKFGKKELEENGVLIQPFIEDRTYSAVKKAAEKFDNAMFVNMSASELVNRGAAYYGAKAKFLNGKIKPKEFRNALGREMPADYSPTMEDAIDYGKAISAKTQFLFGPLDTPVGMSSDIAKTAAQFQTFGLKQQEFIWQMLGEKEYLKFTRYMLSSMLLFAYIGSAFGMRWDDSLKTLRWGYPPIVQFIIDLAQKGVFGKDKYGNKLDPMERVSGVAGSLFTNVVPTGAQIKRSVEGFNAVNEGAVYGKAPDGAQRGDFQYEIDQTPMNYIRGTLFGKGNLPSAQEYYKNKESGKKPSGNNRFSGL